MKVDQSQMKLPFSLPPLGNEAEFDLIVQPRHSTFSVPIKELWAARELLYFFVWRDFRIRYKQAVIGAGWAVLKPLMLMFVFVLVFGIFIRVPTGDLPYSVVIYTGLLPWTFVTTVVSSAAASLVSNASLLTKVYFPRLLLPLSVSIVALVDLIVSLPILLAVMLWFDIPITARILWLPVVFGLMFLLALGIGLIMAVLNVKYRDIGMLLPVILPVWMYASPVIYPIEVVPARWLPLYSLNPFVGLMQATRWALVDATAPTILMMATSVILTGAILVGSVLFFQFAEDTFADVV